MEGVQGNASGRSEDSDKDDAHPSKHHPHEHMFSPVADLFHPTGDHHEHTHSQI
jgi:hypothetical protein